VGRVASRAELLGDAALTKSLFDDLIERAAGVGYRLLVSRIAGTTTLPGGDAAEAGSLVVFVFVIVIVTATLPGGPTGDSGYYGEVAIVGIVEIAIRIGIYRCRGGRGRRGEVGWVEDAGDICRLCLSAMGKVALRRVGRCE